jgi:ABC-type Mn2+/Zn2+ transport system permease subunit
VEIAALPSPLDLLELPVFRTALLELALLALAGGLLGAWIVLRRLAFFTHGAGTAAFPGLVAAEAAGVSPRLAALVVGLGYAGGVERAGRDSRSSDSAAALLLVAALGIGTVLASDVFESGAAVDRLLFGTAIGLGSADLAFSALATALAVAGTAGLGRAWTATGFDPGASAALGLPIRRADGVLLGLVAVAVVASLPAVGALLVASLFVTPAAMARLFARSVNGLLAGSVLGAAALSACGLYASFWLDLPPGPAVAVLGGGAYALCAAATAIWPRAPLSAREVA